MQQGNFATLDCYTEAKKSKGFELYSCADECTASALVSPFLAQPTQTGPAIGWKIKLPIGGDNTARDFPWYKGMKGPPSFIIGALLKETFIF